MKKQAMILFYTFLSLTTVLKPYNKEHFRIVVRHCTPGSSIGIFQLTKWFAKKLSIMEEEPSFAGFDLSKADLNSAYLNDSNLRGASLESAILNRATLENSNLERAILRGTKARETNFKNTNLKSAVLENIDLWKATLTNARLNGASLKESKAYGANFDWAKLQNADLRGLIAHRYLHKWKEKIHRSKVVSWTHSVSGWNGPDYGVCTATKTFSTEPSDYDPDSDNWTTETKEWTEIVDRQETLYTTFRKANLDGANLEGGSFKGAIFTGASLRGANLINSGITRKQLKKTDTTNAVFKDDLPGAVREKNPIKVRILLKRGSSPDTPDALGNLIVYNALVSGAEEIVLLLYSYKAKIPLRDTDGRTPLHWAALNSMNRFIEICLKQKLGKVTDEDKNGNRPLHLAVQAGHAQTVAILKQAGAYLDAPNKQKQTALHLTIKPKRINLFNKLVSLGANKNARDIQGQSVVHLAAQHGHSAFFPHFKNQNVNMYLRDKQGFLPQCYSRRQSIDQIFVDQQNRITLDGIHGVTAIVTVFRNIAAKLNKIAALANPIQAIRGFTGKTILLEGVPGCGKTLLAQALASEADCSFFSVKASQLVKGKCVGDGVRAVEELFKKARNKTPSVIFIDEFDSIAEKRSSRDDSATRDNTATLNQLLTEMTALDRDGGLVILIAATNRMTSLDEAILSRFERKIRVPKPTLRGRKKILVHLIKTTLPKIKGFSAQLINRVAHGTDGFSGRKLRNLVRNARLQAEESRNDDVVLGQDLVVALQKMLGEYDSKEDNESDSDDEHGLW